MEIGALMPFRQTSAVVLNDEESLTEEQSAVLHELFTYEHIPDMCIVDSTDYLKGCLIRGLRGKPYSDI